MPFIEMLESIHQFYSDLYGPSGVPFIEMLECGTRFQIPFYGPSGVPFIEMLEFEVVGVLDPPALAECHSLRC